MTVYNATFPTGKANEALRLPLRPFCPSTLLRIAMHPKTVVRCGAGRGSAWLQENAREHQVRFP